MTDLSEKGIESLNVWRQAVEYVVQVNKKVLFLLPVDERYALVAQLRRSAESVSANIAEGYGRFYYQEGIRFCYTARGSLEESYSHLKVAYKLGYLPEELFKEFVVKTEELRKLLNGYIAFLKRSKRGVDEPGNYVIRENSIYYEMDDDDDRAVNLEPSEDDPSPVQSVTNP
jgi:four helix bundle protein